ncbi:MAG: adaptor protein MecA [Clostridia bacterium]|nr:adaptor protein MecA [Clostridia bacterium]
MKIEKINDDKIKITLSAKDLADRNLDFQSLRYNSKEAQTLFWDMMKLAETEHGFKAANCQLFIEAASIMNGNFIVTITKMHDVPALNGERSLKAKAIPASLKVKRKNTSYSQNCIIKFSSFDSIIDAIRQNSLPTKITSSLYEYNNEYYLVIKPNIVQANEFKRLIILFSEFGEICYDFKYTEGIITEYGTPIILNTAIFELNKSLTKNVCE